MFLFLAAVPYLCAGHRGILDNLKSNFRGNAGNLLASAAQIALPDSCLAASVHVGYTAPGEDDYPFMPLCYGKNVGGSNSLACLPGDALLLTPEYTYRPVADVKPGDVVAVDDKRFATVQYFLHEDPFTKGTLYTELTLEDNTTLTLSADHLVYTCNTKCGFKAIREVEPFADSLVGQSNKSVIASRQFTVRDKGIYAPVTDSTEGTLLVNGIVVSEFSRIPPLSPKFDGVTHQLSLWLTRHLQRLERPVLLQLAGMHNNLMNIVSKIV